MGNVVRVALAVGAVLAGSLAPARGEGTWTTYLYPNNLRDLAVSDDGVWCATGGGALFYDFSLGGFRSWTRSEGGLTSDTLTCVAVLSDGRVAFGTDRWGVSLYDPRTDLWFEENALTWPIVGDAVTFIREDGAWRLIGAREAQDRPGGFVALRDGQVKKACQQGLDICGLPGWNVEAGVEHDGALWLGVLPPPETESGGVARFNYATTATWDTLDVAHGLPSREVRGLAVWQDRLYCATSGAVAMWSAAEGRWIDRSAGLPTSGLRVRALRAGRTRLLLAGLGTGGGVFSWNETAQAWDSLGALQARCVGEGADGTVWAGASAEPGGPQGSRPWLTPGEDGLWEYAGGEWVQHRVDSPHAVGNYRALTLDASGRLWAATADGGRGWRICRRDAGGWSFYNRDNVSQFDNAWVFDLRFVGEDLFVGHCCCNRATDPCYLNIWDPGGTEVASVRAVFNVLDSDADEAGRVWFASLHEAAVDTTTARGIYRFDPASGVWTHCYPGDSDGAGVPDHPDSSLMVSSKVNAVEVEGGYLWIGYYNDGLSRCRLDEDGLPTDRESDWEHFTMDASTGAHLFSNGVRALASRPGEVWIGTTGGLTLWTPTLWKRFETQPTGEVTDIALTDDGAAWVGIRQKGVTRVTREGGLYRYQRFEPPWLVNPTPTAMIAGADGDDVWIGTEAGLSHFVPGGAVGEGPTDRIQVFPNPYNPACPTPLSLLSVPGRAYEGTICDVAGQVVARFREAWSGDAIWNGRDLDGRVVPPGLYVIRATTPRGWLTGKVAVLDLPCVP